MGQNVLIIGSVWPEPASSAAGSRTMQLIEMFRSANRKITFASAATPTEFSADLVADIQTANIRINDSGFDEFIRELTPGLVVFDRFMTEEQFGWRVADICPDALRILDTIDLHCLRQARHSALKEKRAFQHSDLLSDVAKREIASIFRCDLSLIISLAEMQILSEQFKIDKQLLHYLPFMPEPVLPLEIGQWKPFEERAHFITIGNFLHEPNLDAVIFLKKEIWPLIRKTMKKAELHIYGSYSAPGLKRLHSPADGFCIMGRAETAKEVVGRARVCLAPLRFGAGIKGKLVEAMQCGTPSVTTSIGAEGMHGEYNWNGIITDDPAVFARAAVGLYSDKVLWERSQQNGIRIINDFFEKERAQKIFIEAIAALREGLEAHRQNNFTGAMLLHHSMASTKYMSRWIEEKNRRARGFSSSTT